MSSVIETSTITRLQEEKKELQKDYYNDGKISGYQWAQGASYRQLQVALKFCEEIEHDTVTLEEIRDFVLADGFWREYWQEIIENIDPFLQDHLDSYISGWAKGVWSFWLEIKDKLH